MFCVHKQLYVYRGISDHGDLKQDASQNDFPALQWGKQKPYTVSGVSTCSSCTRKWSKMLIAVLKECCFIELLMREGRKKKIVVDK